MSENRMSIYNNTLSCKSRRLILILSSLTSLGFSTWFIPITLSEIKRNEYRLLVGKPEGKRPLGRPRRRWVNNIRTDLGESGWGDLDWIGLAEDRNRWRALVDSVLNFRVP
jgi:hypothetical protein